jgi:hypothetical protein
MTDMLHRPPAPPPSRYDEQLARRILDGDGDAVELAVTLFDRHDPPTLSRAVELVRAYGDFTPGAFDRISQAYDIHRHLRDMPCD